MRAKVSAVEIVLRTRTPEGIEVVLAALVYAKVLEEHAAVADLGLIDPRVGRASRRPASGSRAVLPSRSSRAVPSRHDRLQAN
jgi:hypothetical protein